ncbi:MAG: CHAD domain-containing protein [Dehalococcoidia bacterium]|nr:CHAD domain-containing protein [Dehalococcoidia bacterium]
MAEDSGAMEVEWQFAADDVEPARRWLKVASLPGFTVAPGARKAMRDTYLDTVAWHLYRAGFTCRTRMKDESVELTLKSMAAAEAGLRRRREITELLSRDGRSDPASAPGPCGQTIRALAGRIPLAPLFTLEQLRETFVLADEGGPMAEIAVDETCVVGAGDQAATLERVEVEMLPGADPERARRFVNVLVQAAGLAPAGTSKFGAAVTATGLVPAPPAPALGDETMLATMTAAEAAFAILRRHFRAFLANEPGTRLGEDPEGLHDMRVAARRLRAALAAFRAFLPPRTQRFRDELGWAARVLGEVRDLDVQLERLTEWRTGFTPSQAAALDDLEALLQARRRVARAKMLAALNSRRYAVLVERFAAILRRGPPRSFLAGQAPVLAVAPDLLEKRYRRARRLGDAIGRSSPPTEYHALRIEAKKLRYALEFFGPLYGRQATDFSRRVTALQDLLGLHQDAEVAVVALHALAASEARRLGHATLLVMGAISDRYTRQAVELRAGFPTLYRELRGRDWRRLRQLLEAKRPPVVPLPAGGVPSRPAPVTVRPAGQ